MEVGARRRPRPAATCQRVPPLGVGLWASLRRLAPGDRRGAWRASVSQANLGSTTAAWTGARRPRLGARGRAGARREPEGARGQGTSGPLRRVAWRPRRRRSALQVRASSATAPRIGKSRGAGGGSSLGRSPHAPRCPAARGECIAPEPRLDSGAGHALGSCEPPACHSRQGGSGAEVSKTRTREGRTALAVSAGARRLGARPGGGRRDVGTQAAARWGERLRLWRTAR